jgi:hypothetical protein
MKNILAALNAFALINLASCATDQAAKMRGSKPASVGVWGGAYRPTANTGIVADAAGLVSRESHRNHVDETGNIKAGKGDGFRPQNIKTTESQKIDVGLHFYPMPTSAFHYGFGLERKNKTTNFDAHTSDSSLVEPKYANVETMDQIISVGPTVGWDWIWPNGITVMTDIGPRWQISKSRKFTSSGESENVNVMERDKLIKKFDNVTGFQLLDPKLIVGYSF